MFLYGPNNLVSNLSAYSVCATQPVDTDVIIIDMVKVATSVLGIGGAGRAGRIVPRIDVCIDKGAIHCDAREHVGSLRHGASIEVGMPAHPEDDVSTTVATGNHLIVNLLNSRVVLHTVFHDARFVGRRGIVVGEVIV